MTQQKTHSQKKTATKRRFALPFHRRLGVCILICGFATMLSGIVETTSEDDETTDTYIQAKTVGCLIFFSLLGIIFTVVKFDQKPLKNKSNQQYEAIPLKEQTNQPTEQSQTK